MPQEKALIMVQIQPGAGQNRLVSFNDGVWHLKIGAPPIRGKANRELVEFLGDILGTAKSNITIEKGLTSRRKVIAVKGLTPDQVTGQLVKYKDQSA